MMNVVNRILNRKSETKYITDYTDENANAWQTFNSQVFGANQWAAAIPPLAQGTTDYTRLGDSVFPTSHYTDLHFRINPVSPAYTSPNPVDITIVIFHGVCKKYKAPDEVRNNSAALCPTLLRLGQKSVGSGLETQPFMGYSQEMDFPINDVVWNLKKTTVRLYKAPGVLNGGAGALS